MAESKYAADSLTRNDSRVLSAAKTGSAAAEQTSMLSLQDKSMPMAPVSQIHDGSSRRQPQGAAENEACGQVDATNIQVGRLASSQEAPLPAEHPVSAAGPAESQSDGHHTDVYSGVPASESLAGQDSSFLPEAATHPQGTAAATDALEGRETETVQESASPSQAAAATDLPASHHDGILQGAAGLSQSTTADSQAAQDPGIVHNLAGLPQDAAASSAAPTALHDTQHDQPALQSHSNAVEGEDLEFCASSIIPADHTNCEGAESSGPELAIHDSMHALGLIE